MVVMAPTLPLEELRAAFGVRLEENVPLAPYTAARIGGPADVLVRVNSAAELAETVRWLWQADLPFTILGGGSNVLVSDAGVREVVILNRARAVTFHPQATPPHVWAEAGANLGALARQAASKGYSGLEWAAGVPGTVGGAVVGNAGAHGSDMASTLILAEILHRVRGRESWQAQDLAFSYRSSVLKHKAGEAVVLAARLRLEPGDPSAIKEQMDSFLEYRRRTQPPGASMGSMFKNPPDNYAGRLIEAAGLKGYQVGGAQISPTHANFFINLGGATAEDTLALIRKARVTVAERFGVQLALEIQLVGDWSGYDLG